MKPLTFNELPEAVSTILLQLEALNSRLEKSARSQKKEVDPDEYLTTDEVVKKLKTTRQTINNWRKSGKLKAYGISNRILFKRSEVEAALKPLTV